LDKKFVYNLKKVGQILMQFYTFTHFTLFYKSNEKWTKLTFALTAVHSIGAILGYMIKLSVRFFL